MFTSCCDCSTHDNIVILTLYKHTCQYTHITKSKFMNPSPSTVFSTIKELSPYYGPIMITEVLFKIIELTTLLNVLVLVVMVALLNIGYEIADFDPSSNNVFQSTSTWDDQIRLY